ncbi:NAD-dependent epimerase/dehydratase family protein [Candidatus Nomurabacteria bacterium]|nr:NAD-dependent epimerase/dehydratase family protein [Candidatus Kaiserbacteria bacterium]MCB9815111.1 NAD-dependent epimerase/dehydratase family protein [Candidatus Nomurabacteria bacterium]
MQDQKLAVVTGGAGFIGSHLCERLVKEGYRVISLDNYSTGLKENHVEGAEYREGHTKDIASLITETPDLVFHLGEYARAEQSFHNIEQVLDSNVLGTMAVLEFVRKMKTKLVYAGSSTKFADGGLGKDQSPYAWTKSSNTNLVQRYGDWYGVNYAITYFYNVYGPRERGDTDTGTVIAIFADKVKNGEALTVRKPGTQKRNFTHVDDIVEGLLLAGQKGDGDEYGLGNPKAYSVLELAEMFGGNIEMLEERPGNRMNSEVDIRRAALELGWKPKRELKDYIDSLNL